MAAPSVISKGTASAGTGASVTPTFPASPQTNDIIFLQVISHQPNGIGVISLPTNFTEAAQGTYQNSTPTNQGRAGLFWKRSDGTESGTLTVSRTGDTGADSVLYAQFYLVRGCVSTGDPWDAVTARYGPGNATVTWDAVTVSGSERTLLAFCCQADDAPGVSTPSGYTRTVTIDPSTSGTDAQLCLDDKANVSTDGSATASNGETIGWATFHVSTKPPVATTINVPVGSLAMNGQVPTVVTTSNILIAVGAGGLTLTGPGPTVIRNVVVPEPLGLLSMTGFAPTSMIGTTIPVAAGSLTVTGFYPTVNIAGGGGYIGDGQTDAGTIRGVGVYSSSIRV